MDGWDRRAGWSREVLERIVALLFALANLADSAAGAPFLKRRQVLAILSHGEAAARAYIMGTVFGGPTLADTPEPDETPRQTGDAARLAASFRALALALCALLTRRFALSGAAGPRADRRNAVRPSRRIPAPSLRWPEVRAPPAPAAS